MFEPYDPKKIPVMTHGLGSSPTTWLEMYNALRNAPDIQNAYQFWFYFYPTVNRFGRLPPSCAQSFRVCARRSILPARNGSIKLCLSGTVWAA